MRTCVYVDGFNLFHGALRGTPYKWLDLGALFRTILESHHEIQRIKYFTARLRARPHDPSQPQRQDIYFNALKHHCPHVEFFFGTFLTHTVRSRLANPIRGHRTVDVIKTEEKGSDVNLAVHLLNDAWLDAYDCAVVVTNDSDIMEAMRLVKSQTSKMIGLITPGDRRPSRQLKAHADFGRWIRPKALANSQLPSPVPGTNFRKPDSW